MKKIFETDRLILREFNLDDTAFIIELLNSEGWIKYIGDRNVKKEEQAKNYLINGPLKSYQANGFGLWLVALKENLSPIGMCGLVKRENLENIDIGFAFLSSYSGQGYALESAKATLHFALEILKQDRIVAITLPGNLSSIRLLEKCGLKFEEEFKKDNEVLMLFGINKELPGN
ncbi:MAG: hypothetical protein JWN76_722 [Chitinophagaceae bacterium]|nr:hypothetical protein [Chitinophagaceae bacterium]